MRYLERFYPGSVDLLWAVLLVVLPVTSMPAVRDLLHINTIASPSVLFLGILLVIWLLPYLARNGAIPMEALPLVGFLLVCLLSIAVSVFYTIPSFKDAGIITPSISAFITLLVGVGYLLTAYSLISHSEKYRKTLIWIYLGGLAMIIWSLMQS